MRIALYGGAFDPITTGHVQVIRHVVNNSLAEKVIVIPCYHSLKAKRMSCYHHRLNMCNIAINDVKLNDVCSVSDIERAYHGLSMIEILRKIISHYDNYYKLQNEYYCIVGIDNAIQLPTWNDAEEFMQLCKFYVVPRSDNDYSNVMCDDIWFKKTPHKFLSYTPDPISSTLVRKNIPKLVYDYLTPGVKDYIIENHLYKKS